jgi:transcriptional regulator with GAF, ATPase, and Fis domain
MRRNSEEEIQLVCASPQMVKVAETVRMSGERSLLLTGETGVGKDALARWAHSISPCAEGPFVSINCAAIQESLWESEIFGHGQGAFTGAHRDKAGKVEGAEGGTLFLNEIGEMPLPTQAKLLTFLDTGEFQRVGETETRQVHTRVISATNQDLEEAIEERRFRRDLFYRLAGVHARIPPLMKRPEDVLALAKLFLQALMRPRDVRNITLSEATKELLVNARWKGNVRELEAVIHTAFERCFHEGGNTLEPAHFALEMDSLKPKATNTPRNAIDEVRPYVQNVSEATPNEGPATAESGSVHIPLSTYSIMDDREALKSFLDQIKGPSGQWNISVAYRLLFERGEIDIGRRAFAKRIQKMFPQD